MKFARAALLAVAVLTAAPIVASTAQAASPGWHQARDHHNNWRRHHERNRWQHHREEWRRHHNGGRHHGMSHDAWRRFGN